MTTSSDAYQLVFLALAVLAGGLMIIRWRASAWRYAVGLITVQGILTLALAPPTGQAFGLFVEVLPLAWVVIAVAVVLDRSTRPAAAALRALALAITEVAMAATTHGHLWVAVACVAALLFVWATHVALMTVVPRVGTAVSRFVEHHSLVVWGAYVLTAPVVIALTLRVGGGVGTTEPYEALVRAVSAGPLQEIDGLSLFVAAGALVGSLVVRARRESLRLLWLAGALAAVWVVAGQTLTELDIGAEDVAAWGYIVSAACLGGAMIKSFW